MASFSSRARERRQDAGRSLTVKIRGRLVDGRHVYFHKDSVGNEVGPFGSSTLAKRSVRDHAREETRVKRPRDSHNQRGGITASSPTRESTSNVEDAERLAAVDLRVFHDFEMTSSAVGGVFLHLPGQPVDDTTRQVVEAISKENTGELIDTLFFGSAEPVVLMPGVTSLPCRERCTPENPFGFSEPFPTTTGLLRGWVAPDPHLLLEDQDLNPFSLSEEDMHLCTL